jgi:hypothetical protein
MIGYQLTPEQYDQVQGQFYTPYMFFNCVQDINDAWFLFLSDEDKMQIQGTEWSWILSLDKAEYIPKPTSELLQ